MTSVGNTPVDCNDAVGSFATTSHGTKTCDDVFEVWKARGERNPSSLYRDPLARENCPASGGVFLERRNRETVTRIEEAGSTREAARASTRVEETAIGHDRHLHLLGPAI